MALVKNAASTYIPGNPWIPGSPAVVAQAAYWSTENVTTCGFSMFFSTICGIDENGFTSCFSLPVYTNQCTTNPVFIYHPAVIASPGIPYQAPTPGQINVSLNVGWNSYASSIGKLDAGTFLKYTLKRGTTGALLGVGYAGMEGRPIGAFTHGLMADISTVRPFENAVAGTVLGVPDADIRIARLSSGRIVYAVGSVYYISAAPAYLPSEDLYVYGMLYSGYDEVSTATFVVGDMLRESAATLSGTGTISARAERFSGAIIAGAGNLIASPFPSATLSGIGTLSATVDQPIEATITGVGTVWAYATASRITTASIAGTGALIASPFPSATLAGIGSILAVTDSWLLAQSITVAGRGRLTAEAYRGQLIEATVACTGSLRAVAETGGRAYAALPLFVGLGGDTAYGQASGSLPLFVSGETNGQSDYVPPPITSGYGNLPFIVGAGYASEISIGTGSASLPLFVGLGGDYDYGFARGGLPMFVGVAYGGFLPDDTIALVSPVLATSVLSTQRDIVIILNSTGQLQSTLSMTREQALSLLSTLQAASTLSMLGVYGFSLMSDARALSIQTLSINNRPDLHDSGVVWVVNTTNNASSQYEQYGFNSFFERGGKAYGVANDGIYLLEGSTDNGGLIKALAEMGQSNFGSPQLKSVTNVYLGVGSDNTLYLKVNADSQEYIYEMHNSSPDINNKRVDIGRGMKGNYWNMTLLNKDGADFKLASVVFEPIPLSRKI